MKTTKHRAKINSESISKVGKPKKEFTSVKYKLAKGATRSDLVETPVESQPYSKSFKSCGVSATSSLTELQGQINDGEILNILSNREINYTHLNAIKELIDFKDEVISDWFNVDVKTLRSYRKPAIKFKENVKEQVVVLLALINHGIKVFGSGEEFKQWLNTENFYFGTRKPSSFLNTVTGAKFVDDNLTAIEYGDNV